MEYIGLDTRMTKYLLTGKELAFCILFGIASGIVFGLISILTGVGGVLYGAAVGGFTSGVGVIVIGAMRRNRQAR